MATTEAYERVTWHGETFNRRTVQALVKAEKKLGYELTVLQGSYKGGQGAAASSGTHDGGGAVDLLPYDADRKVRVLRDIGFAAWHRQELWINGVKIWGEHVHAILLGDREASPQAKAQMVDYRKGLDGLASHAPDPTPRPSPIPDYHYRRAAHPLTKRLTDARRQIRAERNKALRPQRVRWLNQILGQLRRGPHK